MVWSGHAFFASYLTHPPLYYRLHAQRGRIEDETHHTVVGHHGPNPVDGCRGGPSGEQDGTQGRDFLQGTDGADHLMGKGENDRIFSLAGKYNMIGGPGKDWVW